MCILISDLFKVHWLGRTLAGKSDEKFWRKNEQPISTIRFSVTFELRIEEISEFS